MVSMSAIMKDVKQLGHDLVVQSKDARDDIVKRATEKVEQVGDIYDWSENYLPAARFRMWYAGLEGTAVV